MNEPNNLADNLDIPIFTPPNPKETDSSNNMNPKEHTEAMQSKIEKIVVIGIGGAGNNAVQYLYNNKSYMETQGQSVEHYCLNTDIGCLNTMECPNKIVLGPDMLNGKGAGANINVGKEATLASLDQIDEICKNVDLVFLTAGMGGGTGTLGASVVAKAAHDKGAVVVSLVTIPFNYENRKKPAFYGIKALAQFSDSLIIIDNQKIVDCFPDAEFVEGLDEANKILSNAIIGVIKVIRNPSKINTDFEDLKTILHNGGKSQILYNEVNSDVLSKLKDDPSKTLDEVYKIVTDSPLVTKSDIKNASSFLILFECTHHFTQNNVHELVNRFSNPNNIQEDDQNYLLDDLNILSDTDQIETNQDLPQVIFAFNRIDAGEDDKPRIIVTVVATGMDGNRDKDKKQYIDSYTSPHNPNAKGEVAQPEAQPKPQAQQIPQQPQYTAPQAAKPAPQPEPQPAPQAPQGNDIAALAEFLKNLPPEKIAQLLGQSKPQVQPQAQQPAAPQQPVYQPEPQPAPQVAPQAAPQPAPQAEAQPAPQRQPTSYNPPSSNPQPSNAQPKVTKVYEAPKPEPKPEAPKVSTPVFNDDDIGIDD